MTVFKKEDNQDYKNYRPVSLILGLSKLIKKIVHVRLCNVLEENSLLFEKQYGFLLHVIIMLRPLFRVNLHSIVA